MQEGGQESGEPRTRFQVGQTPRFLWLAACTCFCILLLSEIWNSSHESQYQWFLSSEGSAIGVQGYRSHSVYIGSLAGEACWYLAGMGLSLAARKRPGLFVGHVILSALWIILRHQLQRIVF